MYTLAVGDFEFGDIFKADWIFDAYLRGDARPLKPFDCHMGRNRPKVSGFQKAEPSPKRDFVLAHGGRHPAVLLTDNCEIESIVERRRRGRLIFAAIDEWPADEAEAQQLTNLPGFRRHPLPPEASFDGGVANLQSLFAVGLDAVTGVSPDPRVVRLDEEAVIDLEIRWTAYATRRGPMTHHRNARKLAQMLTANGDPDLLRALREGQEESEALDAAAANLLAETLTIAWNLEGGVLNDMADAFERAEPPETSRAAILTHLDELRDKVDAARSALAVTRRPG